MAGRQSSAMGTSMGNVADLLAGMGVADGMPPDSSMHGNAWDDSAWASSQGMFITDRLLIN